MWGGGGGKEKGVLFVVGVFGERKDLQGYHVLSSPIFIGLDHIRRHQRQYQTRLFLVQISVLEFFRGLKLHRPLSSVSATLCQGTC